MHFSLTWLGKPVAFARRKIRKHYVDKAALLRDGAEVITPAIDSAIGFSPVNVSMGTEEEIRARMTRVWDGWYEGRRRLLTYLNSHPSDEIRRAGHQAVDAVAASSAATQYLFAMTYPRAQGVNLHDAYVEAEQKNTEAVQAMRDLMEAVRNY